MIGPNPLLPPKHIEDKGEWQKGRKWVIGPEEKNFGSESQSLESWQIKSMSLWFFFVVLEVCVNLVSILVLQFLLFVSVLNL